MTDADIAGIRLLCLDVDGVLTDGSILIDDHGVETKRFHVRDGAAIRIWHQLGNEIVIITNRSGMALRHRAEELGLRHVVQKAGDKVAAFTSVADALGVTAAETAMIGDDLPDLPLLRTVAYPIAVADAADEVLAVARHVTARPGGRGAVREAVEHLLKAQGRWQEALDLYR